MNVTISWYIDFEAGDHCHGRLDRAGSLTTRAPQAGSGLPGLRDPHLRGVGS